MSTNSEYRNLLIKFLPRPIRSEHEYKRAMGRLEQIMVPHPSVAVGQLIELLSTLVENYESQTHPTPNVPPAEMLAHLIEARGLKCADVARDTGITASTLSNVLAKRRGISKANAMKLAAYFAVPATLFFDQAPEIDGAAPIRKAQPTSR